MMRTGKAGGGGRDCGIQANGEKSVERVDDDEQCFSATAFRGAADVVLERAREVCVAARDLVGRVEEEV
eukprot:3420162-Rhodomonas_salina.1